MKNKNTELEALNAKRWNIICEIDRTDAQIEVNEDTLYSLSPDEDHKRDYFRQEVSSGYAYRNQLDAARKELTKKIKALTR